MVVGAITDSICGHDGQVVFDVVRTRIFALAPLGDLGVVACTHDRRPVALTVVIGASTDHTVVT